jgi:phospholipid/cholesterol/gamma-HCH transport system substrate-binding protein
MKDFKPFYDRNRLLTGAVGIGVTVVLMFVSVNWKSLPFVDQSRTYSAYFKQAGGLTTDSKVRVSGFEVGQVANVSLDGPRVLVKFKIDRRIRLGDRAEAAIKLSTLLGNKVLEVTPRGDGQLDDAIPLERTTSPYELPEALGDLANTISGLNTNQLSDSLSTLSTEFADTAPSLRAAVAGVGRFSQTLNERDAELRTLLENANNATAVLAERSQKVVDLVVNTNSLLVELRSQSAALDQLSNNLSGLAQQVKGFIEENRQPLKPSLDKLNGVLALVDNRKAELQKSIAGLNRYALSLGESVSSGPFFNAYLANLLPGQFIQPFIDAAFSDLGLDPNVLAPTQRADPQVGQPATPPLPVPYPRTGQGGEPRLTIPDAITGNPGDQQCGPPGLPQAGPGCYPYRGPGLAPAAGGPPPGPPAPEQSPRAQSSMPVPAAPPPAPGQTQPTDGQQHGPSGSNWPAPVVGPTGEPLPPEGEGQ